MIGIDIVDLSDPLLKKRHSAFRFITHPEDIYFNHPESFWLLWTAKEAIFKAYREVKTFNPKVIPVRIYKPQDEILFSSGEISGMIKTHQDWIMSIAYSAGTIYYDIIKKRTENHSKEIRVYISHVMTQKKHLEIAVTEDHQRLPILDYQKIPVSISHHGRFLAFVCPDFNP